MPECQISALSGIQGVKGMAETEAMPATSVCVGGIRGKGGPQCATLATSYRQSQSPVTHRFHTKPNVRATLGQLGHPPAAPWAC